MNWFKRIGGPNAISLTQWLILLPWSITITLTIPGNDLSDPNQWFLWVLLPLLAQLPVGLIFIIAKRTYLHAGDRKPRPFSALTTFAFAGAVRGVSIGFLLNAFGLQSDVNLFYRVPGGAVLAVFWFSVVAFTVDATRSFRESANRLKHQLELESSILENGQQKIAALHQTATAEVEALIRARLETTTIDGSNQPAILAARLDALVKDVVRPLINQLDDQASQTRKLLESLTPNVSPSRNRVREVFAGLFISRPVLPALAAALVGMTLLPLKILLGGWLVACSSAASSALLVYLGLSAFVRVRRYTTKRFPNFVLVPRLWLAWLAIAFVDAVITRLFPAFAAVPEANVALIMAFDVFVFSFVALSGSIASQRNSTLRQLADAVERNSWAIARLSQMAWAQQRHLAQLVHGDVQSRITAVALSLRYHQASDEEAAQKIAELVAYCKSVLSGNSNPETIDEFLAGAKELWHGTLKINVNESDDALASLRKDETGNMVAVEIIREAISNAVRHGQAKTIDISMILNGPQAKTMTIRIDNDGVSENADLTPGFGSKLLDQLTTSWSLKRGPKGIRLEAQIPLD